MIFHIEVRTEPWPDGGPLAVAGVEGSREAARQIAVELLRSTAEARLADIRLRYALIDQYVSRSGRNGRFIRHLYSAPMRPRRA